MPRISSVVTDTGQRDGPAVMLVYERVRHAILEGDLGSGRVVSQSQLEAMFGVTRTPLREALRLLEQESLVVTTPKRRVQIAPLTLEDLEQLYIMRLGLEGVALRVTIPRLTDEEYAEASGLMAQMDHFAKREDWKRLRVPHRRFHLLLVSGVGERASTLMGQLFDRTERYRHAYWDSVPAFWQVGRVEHREILDAAERRDVPAVAHALSEHYRSTAEAVVRALNPDYDGAKLQLALRFAGGVE